MGVVGWGAVDGGGAPKSGGALESLKLIGPGLLWRTEFIKQRWGTCFRKPVELWNLCVLLDGVTTCYMYMLY